MLTISEVVAKLGVSESTIRNLRLANDFPEPVRLSKRRIAWRVDDIDAWLASR